MACCLEVKHNLTLQTDGNWRLQMWTSNAENISPNIFVWQRKPDVPQAGSPRDFFTNIAQVCDLTEYPDETPGDESSFFRLPYMDVEIRSPERVQLSLDNIARDVDDLVKSMNLVIL